MFVRSQYESLRYNQLVYNDHLYTTAVFTGPWMAVINRLHRITKQYKAKMAGK